jgi:hypothetical protein
MFLRRTSAYSELRERLGQANHLLITILIGIEGVRTGNAKKSDEFHATWNPKSIEESAQRSRRFARDAMLNHIVDSLGVYLSLLREPPFTAALPSLNSTNDRSLKPRLDAFCSDLDLQNSLKLALVHLAIQWRNRRLHTGAINAIERKYFTVLRAAKDDICEQFCGLDLEDLFHRFDESESPRFKEVASLVKGTLDFAQMADGVLVQRLDPNDVACHVIASVLRDRVAMNRRRAGQQWGNTPDDRRRRLKSILTTAGFSDKTVAKNCPGLPDAFINNLASLSFREVADKFSIKLASS